MSDLDAALANVPIEPPTLSGAAGKPCTHPRRLRFTDSFGRWCQCGHEFDATTVRRGKQSRNYGNRAELAVARKYGGTKIGHAGGPVDVRGKDFATQVKTHRRLPPIEWTKSFAAMAQDNRCPRMLLRFVGGPGVPPRDYFVFQADDFLAWFGRDGDDAP